jgi:hypothetical protein
MTPLCENQSSTPTIHSFLWQQQKKSIQLWYRFLLLLEQCYDAAAAAAAVCWNENQPFCSPPVHHHRNDMIHWILMMAQTVAATARRAQEALVEFYYPLCQEQISTPLPAIRPSNMMKSTPPRLLVHGQRRRRAEETQHSSRSLELDLPIHTVKIEQRRDPADCEPSSSSSLPSSYSSPNHHDRSFDSVRWQRRKRRRGSIDWRKAKNLLTVVGL